MNKEILAREKSVPRQSLGTRLEVKPGNEGIREAKPGNELIFHLLGVVLAPLRRVEWGGRTNQNGRSGKTCFIDARVNAAVVYVG
jgi:hypothetical protein